MGKFLLYAVVFMTGWFAAAYIPPPASVAKHVNKLIK